MCSVLNAALALCSVLTMWSILNPALSMCFVLNSALTMCFVLNSALPMCSVLLSPLTMCSVLKTDVTAAILCSGARSCSVYRCVSHCKRCTVLQCSSPECQHRKGGCLACWRLQGRYSAEAALIYTMHGRGSQGVLPMRVGVRPVNRIHRLWRHCS